MVKSPFTAPLWLREFRGAERNAVRKPWAVPAFVALWVIVAHAMGWEIPLGGPPPFINYWPPGALVALYGPQSALALAMVGIVSWSVISDRGDVDLRLSLLSPSEIILAKTFAPTVLTALLIAALGFGEAVWAASQGDEKLLWRAGLYQWARAKGAVSHSSISDVAFAFDLSEWKRAALIGIIGARTLLLALALVTLTSWLASRRVDPGSTMMVSVMLFTMLVFVAFTAEMLARQFVLPSPGSIIVPGLPHVAAEWRVVNAELAMMLFTRVVLPVLWLVWWWRWTKRGFGREYWAEHD